jgi:rhodanese-related sulfurtransferase
MVALLARAVVVVAASAAIGLGVNAMRPGGLRFGSFEAPALCDAAEAAGAPLELAPSEVAGMCGRSDVVVADARPDTRFAEGHVAGAIHLPCDATGSVAAEAMAHLDGKTTVIVYGEITDDAQPVAASLRRRNHRAGVRIAVLRGGFQAWSQAGQACASGPCDECKKEQTPTQTLPVSP